MSVWYHLDVTAIAADKKAVAKFFNLADSWEEVRTEWFEFSFGGKNAPGLRLCKIMEQNPDLIFLIKQSIECSTVQWFLMRFDVATGQQQDIMIQDSGDYNNEINKKILEEYTKENPSLVQKHFARQKGYEDFRWTMFFLDFNKSAAMLSQADQYQEMVSSIPITQQDIEFDNIIPDEYA